MLSEVTTPNALSQSIVSECDINSDVYAAKTHDLGIYECNGSCDLLILHIPRRALKCSKLFAKAKANPIASYLSKIGLNTQAMARSLAEITLSVTNELQEVSLPSVKSF